MCLPPPEIRDTPVWLIWNAEHVEGEAKPRKIPYYSRGGKRTGQQGSIGDRAGLTTYAEAREAASKRNMTGVGLALMPEMGITALDFDYCIGDNGEIPDEIGQIVNHTYAEISPSGRGIRAFVKGDYGNHKSPSKGNDFGFETFHSSGFTTFTGQVLPVVELMGYEDQISDLDALVRPLCEKRFGAREGKTTDPDDFMLGHEPRLGLSAEEIEELVAKLDPSCGREPWITVGMSIHHETEGDDTGLQIWTDWSSLGDNFASAEDVEKNWDSFSRRQRSGERQVTMRSVLKMVKDAARIASTGDLAAAAQEGAALAITSPSVSTPQGYDGKFPVHSASELAGRPPIQWLIKGIIPKADLVMLYGPSGSGKTFVALQLAAAIARGVEWRGRRVAKGRVIIIAAEGAGGVGKRVEAYAREAGIALEDIAIGIIIVPPNFCEKEDITELVKAILASGGADFIIVDTLAQVTPGANENSGEDMGVALANCRALRVATDAVVMLVHHAGKDVSRGARGWSGTRAAVDAEIEIIREEDGTRQIHISKMKDGEDGLRFGFKLEVVPLGIDADGDAITSCIVVESDLPTPEAKETRVADTLRGKLGPVERLLLDTVEQDYPTESRVRYDDFISAVMEKMPVDEDKRDTRKQRVVRALEGLCRGKDSVFSVANGFVLFYID